MEKNGSITVISNEMVRVTIEAKTELWYLFYQQIEAFIEGYRGRYQMRKWLVKGEIPRPGRNIYYARKEKGLTQKQLSERTGISECDISRFECSSRAVSVGRAKRIAAVLNCDYRDFL